MGSFRHSKIDRCRPQRGPSRNTIEKLFVYETKLLIGELAEDGGADELALERAKNITAMPPLPVRMIKQGASVAAGALNHAVSFMGIDQYTVTITSEDHAAGI